MASSPITSWEIDGEIVEIVADFILGGSKITAVGDCSHEIKRCLLLEGVPWWLRWQSVCRQCGRPEFDPWVRKIPWRRKWQPNPVLLPGKSHGQRSLVDYSSWGHKESDTTEQWRTWQYKFWFMLNSFISHFGIWQGKSTLTNFAFLILGGIWEYLLFHRKYMTILVQLWHIPFGLLR